MNAHQIVSAARVGIIRSARVSRAGLPPAEPPGTFTPARRFKSLSIAPISLHHHPRCGTEVYWLIWPVPNSGTAKPTAGDRCSTVSKASGAGGERIRPRSGAVLGPIAAQQEYRPYLTGSIGKSDVEFSLAAPAAERDLGG